MMMKLAISTQQYSQSKKFCLFHFAPIGIALILFLTLLLISTDATTINVCDGREPRIKFFANNGNSWEELVRETTIGDLKSYSVYNPATRRWVIL